MQFKASFVLLLASLLSASQVDAVPISSKRSFTISVIRHVQRRDPHPLINFQQNANRGLRRLARMTGREVPSDEELTRRLYKRIMSAEGEEGLSKRFNRHATNKNQKGQNQNGGNQDGGNQNGGASSSANNSPIPVTDANAPTTANSLGLDIEGSDISYLAQVQMGTPPSNFLLLMDSGSADLWVGSENCQSTAGGGCGNHKFLGSQSSSTFVDTQEPFNVTYGAGAVAGTKCQDTLTMGNFTLNAHPFGTADQETNDFSDDSVPFDGLMGFGQSTLSQQGNLTPIESLAKAGLVSEAISSFKISRLADHKNDGELTLGALDPSKFDAQSLVTIDNVSPLGFWEVPLDAVTVDGQDSGLKGRTAILDTGTTLIIAPQTDAEAVHQLIKGSQSDGQGGFTVPCQANASVALTFGGKQFNIDFRDIALEPVDPNNPNGDCVSGISGGSVGGDSNTEWLCGDVFLKNAYFSTNVNKNQVSLANLV